MFCKDLPRSLSQLLYNEYQTGKKELDFLIKTYPKRYKWIDDIESIYLLLALSIFYRRIIAQLESAKAFSDRLFGLNIGNIQVGVDYIDEKVTNQMSSAIYDFYQFLKKFHIFVELFDYFDYRDFLKNIKNYHKILERKNDLEANYD